MLRLIYFSTAHADVKSADVDVLVTQAAARNPERGITGALAYNGRNFCQCLEGPEDEVRALMAIIEKDARHSGVKTIDVKPITERYFGEWSMQRVDGLNFSIVIDAMKA